jgi:hypothetical protein
MAKPVPPEIDLHSLCKCNQALIVGFGDNDHTIRGLMSFIEMTSRYNKIMIIHVMVEPQITKRRGDELKGF